MVWAAVCWVVKGMSGDLGSGGSAEGGADPWSGQSCSAGDLWAPLLCLGTDFRECPEMVERWAHECGKRSVHGFHSTVRGNSSPEKVGGFPVWPHCVCEDDSGAGGPGSGRRTTDLPLPSCKAGPSPHAF